MTIRIAFTGTGCISKTHAAAARSAPDVELAAVVNHRHESLAEFATAYTIRRQYANVNDLLKDGGVDAVYESARTGDVVRL